MKKSPCTVLIRLAVISFAAVLFLATWAQARQTTPEEAKTIVMNWLHSEAKPMNTALGGQIRQVQTFDDAHISPAYYVVFLRPAGLVFVPADDLVEPIIGFVSDATSFDPSLSNPLGALVSRDIPGRVLQAREMEASAAPGALFPAADSPLDKARNKWDQLKSGDQGGSNGLNGISDVRIAPLVKSRWSQGGADGSLNPARRPCFNYYTPPYEPGDKYNYPCGCTATAMAQLMRFWQYPTTGVGAAIYQIKVDGAPTTRSLRGGDGAGGPYSWAEMPLITSSSTPTMQCQAIGALTADAGVSTGMQYTKDVSGAWSWGAFTQTFGYSNAIDAYNSGDNFPEDSLLAILNPNLDARHPVLVDITGPSDGHAVVCDGYGYNRSTLYHHFNMGWLGNYDAWYNLPNGKAGSFEFNSVYGATYNIFVTGAGEIISGRVTDSRGHPIDGASVAGALTGGAGTYGATTDGNGIYALLPVPSNSRCNVSITKGGYIFPAPQAVSTGSSTQMTVTTGNVWGVDFVGDVDPSHFSVTAPLSASAGRASNFTIRALDADNKIVKSYSGTVHFTSSDPSAALPEDSTLTNGAGRFSVIFNTAGSQTITATDTGTGTITGTSSHIKVNGRK